MAYRFSESDIIASVTCEEIIRRYAPTSEKQGGRWQATWRGGDGYNVAITDNGRKWHDFGGGAVIRGETVINLYVAITGKTYAEACNELGEMYCPDKEQEREPTQKPMRFPTAKKPTAPPTPAQAEAQKEPQMQQSQLPDDTPKPKIPKGMVLQRAAKSQLSKREQMVADGYILVHTWDYTDHDVTRFSVERWERGDDKTFLQRNAAGEYHMDGVELIPYNLDMVRNNDCVYIVEGEKCADMLIKRNLCASTAPAGAGKWLHSYNQYFAKKDIVIVCDNDEAGKKHGEKVFIELSQVAARIKVIWQLSDKPKYDVADYLMEHSSQEFMRLADSVEWATPSRYGEVTEQMIQDAKVANLKPFRNYAEKEPPAEDDEKKGKKKKVKVARLQQEMMEDLHVRALGYPYVISGVLFDYSKQEDGNHKIVYLNSSDDVTAWIGSICNSGVDFQSMPMSVSMKVFQSYLIQKSHEFEFISRHPHYPFSPDTFYDLDNLPPATNDHRYAKRLFQYFNPATPEDLAIIKAMFLSLMWHPLVHFSRPGFFIDSADGKGVGKTTLVNILAFLMNCGVRDCQPCQFDKFGLEELKKTLVSAEGKSVSIILLDNLDTELSSSTIASLMTADSITARPPYGHGDVKRSNDLTFIFTANSGGLDTDLACRVFLITLKRQFVENWETSIKSFIIENRLQIWADLIDMMANPKCQQWEQLHTRFPEFDRAVLMPACETEEMYRKVRAKLEASESALNTDYDLAETVNDALQGIIEDVTGNIDCDKPNMETDYIFIQTQVVKDALKRNSISKVRTVSAVINLAKDGKLKRVDKDIQRIKTDGKIYQRGIMYLPSCETPDMTKPIKFINVNREGKINVSLCRTSYEMEKYPKT